jgi:hypothetical protein
VQGFKRSGLSWVEQNALAAFATRLRGRNRQHAASGGPRSLIADDRVQTVYLRV